MSIRKLFVFLVVSLFLTSFLYAQKPAKRVGVDVSATTAAAGFFNAGGVTFRMGYVPEGLITPNKSNCGVDRRDGLAYWIGETEVTYDLWYKVREWAEKDGGCKTSGQGCYKFNGKGREGSSGVNGAAPTSSKNEPVTQIYWGDAMIWCNALTEWYNSIKKTKYVPVYYSDDANIKIIRTYDEKNSVDIEGVRLEPYVKSDANGFRLPTEIEWEIAARFIGTKEPDVDPLKTEAITNTVNGVTYYWTPLSYASGAIAPCTKANKAETKKVAWCCGESKTRDVTDKNSIRPNALGLYDMSGNVSEFCFDFRTRGGKSWSLDAGVPARGGPWSFAGDEYLSIGECGIWWWMQSNPRVGFRLARTEF